MAFPSFKKITLNSSEPDLLIAQLDQLDFRSRPHILSLHKLPSQQEACIQVIGKYFQDHPQKLFPYPPYVLTTVKSSPFKEVSLINSEDQLPKFFKVKERPLNHKETNLMNRIELQQKNFRNINMFEALDTISKYADNHRELAKIQSEIDYLDHLFAELEIWDGY